MDTPRIDPSYPPLHAPAAHPDADHPASRAAWLLFWLCVMLAIASSLVACGEAQRDTTVSSAPPAEQSAQPPMQEPAPAPVPAPAPEAAPPADTTAAPPSPPAVQPAPHRTTRAKRRAPVAADEARRTAEAPRTTAAEPPRDSAAAPDFPWPPPQASGQQLIPNARIALAIAHLPVRQTPTAGVAPSASLWATLGDADAVITAALDQAGYTDRSYYRVPGGYALATRLERIQDDGRPLDSAHRWDITPERSPGFSLSDYLRALFATEPGLYRVIVFVLRNGEVVPQGAAPTADTAEGWVLNGGSSLPAEVAARPFDTRITCTALIYEFEKPPAGEATLHRPGHLTARQHLERSQLWAALNP